MARLKSKKRIREVQTVCRPLKEIKLSKERVQSYELIISILDCSVNDWDIIKVNKSNEGPEGKEG